MRSRAAFKQDCMFTQYSEVLPIAKSATVLSEKLFLGVDRPVCSKQIVDTLLSLCLASGAWSASLPLAARKPAYSSAKLGACLSLAIVTERRRSCSEWSKDDVELAELPGVAESRPAEKSDREYSILVETPAADTTKTEASGNADTTPGTHEAKSLERDTSEGEGQVRVNLARARVRSLRRPRIRSSKSTQDDAFELAWQNVDGLLPASEKQKREERKILKSSECFFVTFILHFA